GRAAVCHALVVAPGPPPTAYQPAGTPRTDRVGKSVEGGASWTAVRGPLPFMESLAIDPVDSNRLFLGTGRVQFPPIFVSATVQRTTDAGATWATTDLPVGHVQALAVDPTDHLTVYAGTDSGVWKSVDGGATFPQVGSGIPLGQPVIGLAGDRSNPS